MKRHFITRNEVYVSSNGLLDRMIYIGPNSMGIAQMISHCQINFLNAPELPILNSQS
jgi:hypothetical protein